MMTDLPVEKLAVLLSEFDRSGARELHIRCGDFELYLSTDGTVETRSSSKQRPVAEKSVQSTTVPVARAGAAPDIPDGASIIAAPNIGTFYRAPKPGAAAYVEIGSEITVGAEVCLIEVMKLFTAVRSDVSGRVAAILVDDGAMVEAGQPLFAITRN